MSSDETVQIEVHKTIVVGVLRRALDLAATTAEIEFIARQLAVHAKHYTGLQPEPCDETEE